VRPTSLAKKSKHLFPLWARAKLTSRCDRRQGEVFFFGLGVADPGTRARGKGKATCWTRDGGRACSSERDGKRGKAGWKARRGRASAIVCTNRLCGMFVKSSVSRAVLGRCAILNQYDPVTHPRRSKENGFSRPKQPCFQAFAGFGILTLLWALMKFDEIVFMFSPTTLTNEYNEEHNQREANFPQLKTPRRHLECKNKTNNEQWK